MHSPVCLRQPKNETKLLRVPEHKNPGYFHPQSGSFTLLLEGRLPHLSCCHSRLDPPFDPLLACTVPHPLHLTSSKLCQLPFRGPFKSWGANHWHHPYFLISGEYPYPQASRANLSSRTGDCFFPPQFRTPVETPSMERHFLSSERINVRHSFLNHGGFIH